MSNKKETGTNKKHTSLLSRLTSTKKDICDKTVGIKKKVKQQDKLSDNDVTTVYRSGNVNNALSKNILSKFILGLSVCCFAFSLVGSFGVFKMSFKNKADRYAFDASKYMILKPLTSSSILLAENENGKSTESSKLYIFCKGRYWAYVNEQNKIIRLGEYKKELENYKNSVKESEEKESFNARVD